MLISLDFKNQCNSCKLLKDKAVIFFIVLLTVMIGCGGGGKFRIPEPIPDDRVHFPKAPRNREINLFGDAFDRQFSEQIEQSFDFSRQLRNISGKRKQAMNIDAFGEVPNSSWFTNRNWMKRMSIEEIARGPNTWHGPDTSGFWTIFRAKTEGVTPGFHIIDSQGNRYVIKFDPLWFSELATGAEAVSTKLFYALGYNVPENYVAYFHTKILQLGERVNLTDKKGRKRLMKKEDFEEILTRIEYLPDGRIRCLASKYIPGTRIGPFKYKSTRKDDPNDIIPHQHRRELRGLRVLVAWLNHFDTKAGNSLDSYITEDRRTYVKHYLIDFGSTLGSAAKYPMPPNKGHENAIDPHELFKNIVTLGLYVHPYEKLEKYKYSSIGLYESSIFHPQNFKPHLPNPAFENMTNLDGYWGAKLVMSFTDEQLKAVVTEGQYSKPEAVEYLVKTLIERRDIIGRYWFSRVNPLDKFELQETSDGRQELCFVDLAVKGRLESTEQSKYHVEIRRDGELVSEYPELENSTCISLIIDNLLTHKSSDGSSDLTSSDSQWEVKIKIRRGVSGRWSKWVKVYLTLDTASEKFALLGVRRQE